jgi:hypothetical protein
MEAFMRTLSLVMTAAVGLGLVIAWPTIGEAQNKKSSARGAAATQQKPASRPKAVADRSAAQKPCAGYAWWGCTGWDPDPNIRAMLARDVGGDD